MYVFDGQVSLAHAAVTIQRMRDQGGHLSGEPLVNVAQEVFAAREIRVTRRHADPDGW